MNTVDRIRFFIEDHPWWVTGTLLALLVVVVIAWAITTSSDSQIGDLKGQLADARHELSSLRDRLQKRTRQRNDAIDNARTATGHGESNAKSQPSGGAAAPDQGKQAGSQRARARGQGEQGSTPAEGTQKSSTIPGDGVWQYGRDYGAGSYRARGGKGCYWSTLRDASPRHIIDYDVSVRRPAVELGPDTPFFKTVHCGKWVKVG